jgi:hypothetical protein
MAWAAPFRLADGISVARPEIHRGVSANRRRELALRPGASVLRDEDVGYYVDVQKARLQQLGDVASLERRGATLVVTLAGGPRFEPVASSEDETGGHRTDA